MIRKPHMLVLMVGLIGTLSILVGSVSAGTQHGKKVEICHIPPGNPDNAHTISIAQAAVDAHLGHGDTLGHCEASDDHGDDGDGGDESEGDIQVSTLVESGLTEVINTNTCDEFGNCQVIAIILHDDLIDALGTLAIGDSLPYDYDPNDSWYVEVYYLGYQDRDGDGVFEEVYQINVYDGVDPLPVNDRNLILISDDGTVTAAMNP